MFYKYYVDGLSVPTEEPVSLLNILMLGLQFFVL